MRTVSQTLRRLARAPGFAIATISMIAFGVGAATAIFSVVDAVLLDPLSPDEDRIVVMYRAEPGADTAPKPISLLDFHDWRDEATSFEELGAFGMAFGARSVGHEAAPQDARSVAVTTSFFNAAGVEPLLGRGFLSEDEQPEAELVAIVSYRLWLSAFGGDESIIGQRIELEVGEYYTVVGVMPGAFRFPHQADVWLVARLEPPIDRRGWDFMFAIGKLAPSATIEEARAEVQLIDAHLWEETRPVEHSTRIDAIALSDFALKGDTRSTIAVIVSAIALLVVITFVNVMSLCLARAVVRQREVAIRAALGATGFQRAVGPVQEIAVVSVVGGLLGIWLAQIGLSTFLALAPGNVPRLEQAGIDSMAMLFAAVVTGAVAVFVSIFPAVATTHWSPLGTISSVATFGSHGASSLRQAFTIFQIAGTAFLVILAALLSNSLLHLSGADFGYRPEQLLFVEIAGPRDPFEEPDGHRRLLGELLPQLSSIPSIRSAAAVSMPPFALDSVGWDIWFVVESQGFGFVPQERKDRDTGETHTYYAPPLEKIDQNPLVNWESVSGNYFLTMGIALLEGRTFDDDRDRADAPRVVIVGESFAERLWPGESAVGKRMLTYGHSYDENRRAEWQEVVGVVADARYREIDTTRLDVYVPYLQAGSLVPSSLALRTLGDPVLAVNEVRGAVRAVDPSLRLERIRTMESVLGKQLLPWRFNAALLVVFSAAALLLAAAGVFSVLAQSVGYRTREIGIRFSLGATGTDILRLIVGLGMRLVLAGLVAGLGLAFLVSRTLSAHLYQVSPTDLATYVGASILITIVGLVASYVPARRAAGIHPSVALRHE